jgi:SAM-dependent methyltransferase
MFSITEISLADTTRLYEYKQKNNYYEITFDIKGFDYGWLLASRNWKSGEKVLDVGGAYSAFPNFLTNHFGCESWVVDDFGIGVDDKFWQRHRSPQEHIAEHKETRYVLERLGNPSTSSLPEKYFDVVYSASVLEHVPYNITPAVWQHMVKLLKPGGELIHAIDIPFPSNGGLKKMIQAMIFDILPWMFTDGFKLAHYMATPKSYFRVATKVLEIKDPGKLEALNVWKMVLTPEILCEPVSFGWNRIEKDDMMDYHFTRVGSLLLHFKNE